jgi:hypothetical protein
MVLFLWGALSDKRTGLSFVYAAGALPAQSSIRPSPLGLATIFYTLRFETSLFVASYGSQGLSLYSLGSDHSTENTSVA